MIHSVGIDFHRDQHRARCLDDQAQPCDSFSFQTTPEGLATLEEHIFRDGANPIIVFEPAGLAKLQGESVSLIGLEQLRARVEEKLAYQDFTDRRFVLEVLGTRVIVTTDGRIEVEFAIPTEVPKDVIAFSVPLNACLVKGGSKYDTPCVPCLIDLTDRRTPGFLFLCTYDWPFGRKTLNLFTGDGSKG